MTGARSGASGARSGGTSMPLTPGERGAYLFLMLLLGLAVALVLLEAVDLWLPPP